MITAPTDARRVEVLAPLDKALDLTHDDLKNAASANDVMAQYGLSIAYQYGLRGAPQDSQQALYWRNASFSATTVRPIGVYSPGVNGKPGHTRVRGMVGTVIIPYQQTVVDGCVAYLAGENARPNACGNPEQTADLATRWAASRTRVN